MKKIIKEKQSKGEAFRLPPPNPNFRKSAGGDKCGLTFSHPHKYMEQQEIRWKGYIRKAVWEDLQQRHQTRLYTGITVYNMPHLFVEPQDENEWLEVEVVIRVEKEVKK